MQPSLSPGFPHSSAESPLIPQVLQPERSPFPLMLKEQWAEALGRPIMPIFSPWSISEEVFVFRLHASGHRHRILRDSPKYGWDQEQTFPERFGNGRRGLHCRREKLPMGQEPSCTVGCLLDPPCQLTGHSLVRSAALWLGPVNHPVPTSL